MSMDWKTVKEIVDDVTERAAIITALYFLYRLLMALLAMA